MRIMTFSLLFLLVSCGVIEKNCPNGVVGKACQAALGSDKDLQDQIDKANGNISSLDNRVSVLEKRVEDGFNFLITKDTELQSLLLAQQSATNDELININNQINSVTSQLNVLQTNFNTQLTNLANQIITLNSQIVDMNGDLVTLENSLQNSVTEIIDPCGDAPGFDEVILKTKNGKFLAYFENGSKRFLTKLTNGTFMTTDGSSCTFTVSGTNLTF